MSLDRGSLLAALARKIVEVEVSEVGGTLHFREMSVRERMEFNKRLFGGDGTSKVSPQTWALSLVAASVCDAEGAPVFADDDLDALWGLSEMKLAALAKHAERVNGLSSAGVEEAEKNSEPAEKSTSASTSPKRSE